MADYGCWPLWDVDNPNDLPLDGFNLPDNLRTRLEKWTIEFEQSFDWDNPGDSTPTPSGVAEVEKAWAKAFRKEGAFVWLELRKELAEEYEISYFAGKHRFLTDPKELENFAFWTS